MISPKILICGGGSLALISISNLMDSQILIHFILCKDI